MRGPRDDLLAISRDVRRMRRRPIREIHHASHSAQGSPPDTLPRVHTGKSRLPPRILVYGIEGVGKSTLASKTPKPIFIQTEDGLGEIDCHKFPLARLLEDVENALTELHVEKHDYQTVAIDSLDWLEQMIWDRLCKMHGVASIEKVDGGSVYKRACELDAFDLVIVDEAHLIPPDGEGMYRTFLAEAKVINPRVRLRVGENARRYARGAPGPIPRGCVQGSPSVVGAEVPGQRQCTDHGV
jgi:hypothetical protein